MSLAACETQILHFKWSERVDFDPGELILESFTQTGEWPVILNIQTEIWQEHIFKSTKFYLRIT